MSFVVQLHKIFHITLFLSLVHYQVCLDFDNYANLLKAIAFVLRD